MELQALALQAGAVLREAGELIRSIPHPAVTSKEGHANFVTEADVASQTFLLERLGPLFPQARFFAEEQEEHQLAPGWNWIVDPIDGTTNFIRRYRPSAISAGLVKDGEGMLGLVYDPWADELFSAVRGQGAFCTGSWPRLPLPWPKRCSSTAGICAGAVRQLWTCATLPLAAATGSLKRSSPPGITPEPRSSCRRQGPTSARCQAERLPTRSLSPFWQGQTPCSACCKRPPANIWHNTLSCGSSLQDGPRVFAACKPNK